MIYVAAFIWGVVVGMVIMHRMHISLMKIIRDELHKLVAEVEEGKK